MIVIALFSWQATIGAAAKDKAGARRSDSTRAEKAAATSATGGAVATAIREKAGGAMKRFYAGRDYRPLWGVSSRSGGPANTLIGYLMSAEADGLRPGSYNVDKLQALVAAADGGDPRDVAAADLALSEAFSRYVRDQRNAGNVKVEYADRSLKPRKFKPEMVLRAAAFPKSFADYVEDMGWMSPQYVRLRTLATLALRKGAPRASLGRLRVNLDRARILPGPWTRHVEVDASSARLWYYEAGKQVGTMRVVVGAQETQTPMLVGSLQWAIVNPYWNVPDYLAQKSIAKKVLGGRTLASLHMEALSDWSANARRLPADSIDWQAVASGQQVIRLRELPWAANSMGKVKFIFPNNDGIYLHDTPERDLLRKDDRHFSNGCIRLEDALTLGKWLLQRSVPTGKTPENAIALPVSVPVYLTYLTANSEGGQLAFRPDVYGRDD